MEPNESDYVFKVLLLGEAAVGKTSLSSRFVKSEFSTNYSVTLCLDVLRKAVTIDNNKVGFQIWDTVGQERFRTLTSAYYKGKTEADPRREGDHPMLQCGEQRLVRAGHRLDAEHQGIRQLRRDERHPCWQQV